MREPPMSTSAKMKVLTRGSWMVLWAKASPVDARRVISPPLTLFGVQGTEDIPDTYTLGDPEPPVRPTHAWAIIIPLRGQQISTSAPTRRRKSEECPINLMVWD